MKKILGLIFILSATFTYAAEVEWNDRLEGDDVIGGALFITDGDFGATNYVDINSFGYVRLGLNDKVMMDYLSLAGTNTITVNLSIVPFDNNGSQNPTITTSIEMEYSNESGTYVIDASDYRMPDVHKFQVSVTGVLLNGASVSTLGNYVYLQAGVFAKRYYELDLFSAPAVNPQMIEYSGGAMIIGASTTETVAGTDEIFLNWNYIDGAEYYELEWTWVDNYKTPTIPPSTPDYILASQFPFTESDFKLNSTRIRTSDQSYRIPQIFSEGYLIYRVRAVGRWLDSPDKELFGRWSLGGSTSNYITDWGHVRIAHAHEGGKNWQYQSTYAEDGKKKEVVQYFDGSLRGRQTVTRINSDDHSIVGETIYDNEGRPVIQVLPVPQDNQAIEFYPSINESSVYSVPFSHYDFDWEEGDASCDPVSANPLSNSKGAAKYYSPAGYNSSLDQDWQQYVPSSNGYPYTQVEYTPDNTGRVRNQSGVGTDHTIGSGHETYYYYTQPSQEELDRLFGYKVGYKSRYKKNMVVDANGQVSVSYLDAQGRVIATALAGNNQTSFDALSSESDNTFHKVMKTDLLTNGNPYVQNPNPWNENNDLDDNHLQSTGVFGNLKDELSFDTQLAVPQTTDYEINYDIQTGKYIETCDLEGVSTQGVEFEYKYDLDIKLFDDCGTDHLADNGVTPPVSVFSEISNFGMNNPLFPLNSNAGSPPNGVQLEQGSYTLNKSLRVNKESLEAYKEIYLSDANACILTWTDFDPGSSTGGCLTSCEECAQSLGANLTEYMEFVAQDLNVDVSTLDQAQMDIDYQARIKECYEPCAPVSNCDVYSQLIKMDVSPNGQYASPASGTPGATSIFTSGYWRSSDFVSGTKEYVDEFGDPAVIQAYETTLAHPTAGGGMQYQVTPNGQPAAMVEPWQLKMDDFISMFEPSWAEALMDFHPEYPLYLLADEVCTYVWATPSTSDVNLTSEGFDNVLREQIMDWASASSNIYSIDFTSGNPLYSQDPYFALDYTTLPLYGSADLDVIKNTLMNEAITSNYKGQGMSMIKYAIKTAIYGNDLTVTVPSETWSDLTGTLFSTAQKDAIWATYKSYYLSYKAEIHQLVMDFYGFGINYNGGGASQLPGIFNGCIGPNNSMSAGILPAFSFSSSYPSLLALWIDLWNIGSFPLAYPVSLCGNTYDSKELRFYRIDALSNPASSTVANATQLSQDADYVQWQQTGLCPLTVDMERLLNSLLTQHAAGIQAQTALSQSSVVEFVPDLYEAFTGVSLFNSLPGTPNSTTMNNTIMTSQPVVGVGGNLVIKFSSNGVPVGEVQITQPTRGTVPTTLSWQPTDFGVNWAINSVSHSYPTGTGNTVQLVISVDDLSTPLVTEFEEYIISYTISGASLANFNQCTDLQSSDNDPNCQLEEEFEAAMVNLLQTLIEEGDINSSSVSLSVAPYDEVYGNSALATVLGGASPVWNGASGANATITTFFGTFSLGVVIPSNLVFVNGFNLNAATSTYEVNWVTGTTGSYQNDLQTYSYSYEDNTTGFVALDFSCPCEEDALTKDIPAFVQDIAQEQLDGATHTYLSSISDYLGISNPLIYDWNQTATGITFEVYDQSFCYLEGGEGDLICEGEPCIVNLVVDENALSGSISVGVANYTGNNEFEFTVNGYPAQLFISCLTLEECDDCVTEPTEPVSCSDAYEDYSAQVELLYGAPFGTQLEQDIFAAEHLVSEETFCKSSYAYITEAYITYIGLLNINTADDPNYLTISEFGSTPIGYSNLLLTNAVDAYEVSGYTDPASVDYIPWNQYVSEVYLELNTICPATSPPPYLDVAFEEFPCDQWENNIEQINAFNQYQIYLQQMGDAFEQAYIEGAMASVKESFYEVHEDKEYHYTLYTYDRAGNLVSTVPPKGVNRFEYDANGAPIPNYDAQTSAPKTDILDYRATNTNATSVGPAGAQLAPEHDLETEYRYNSLNQLVYQHTPDGGESKFAYDALGRLVMSQNAKQAANSQYSYTKYDGLGRVVEVGELTYIGTSGINENGKFYTGNIVFQGVDDPAFPDNLSMNREEVTKTIYDELGGVTASYYSTPSTPGTIMIRDLFGGTYASYNTRNRIVGVVYQEVLNSSISEYESATFYDYDVHGNVKHLIQVINSPYLRKLNHHIKHTEYEYDLVSGNVNKVIYQRGEVDQFIHRYTYDSDNRITIAETSKDDVIFEKDAKYFYYEHGPLARMEIGEKKVQSSDYAYTIQGWLKSVNGEKVDATSMMGQDGLQSVINSQGGRDAYGFSLSYFDDDYEASNTAMLNYSASFSSSATSLYNGNIRKMHTALSDEHENALMSHETSYSYDQLNRIKSMDGYFPEISSASGYSSTYSFDANGNLETLTRNAHNGMNSVVMDNFIYEYDDDVANGFNNGQNNRLLYVNDQAGASAFMDADIDNSMMAYSSLNNYNYDYDEIGQLIQDLDEDIVEIRWKVTNKVEEIHFDSDDDGFVERKLHFNYDAMGNRISKQVQGYAPGSAGNAPTITYTELTYYFLDAQGNSMSIYDFSTKNDILWLTERNMYGSSRVGLEQANQSLDFNSIDITSLVSISSSNVDNQSSALCGTASTIATIEYDPGASATYVFDHTISDYNSDGVNDLTITNAPTASNTPILINGYAPYFTAQLAVNTIPGEQYTLSYDILNYSGVAASSSPVYECDGNTLLINPLYTGVGSYSTQFTATSTKTRIKWFNISDTDVPAEIVLSNIQIFGKGDVLGIQTPHDEPYITSNTHGDKRYELANHLGNVLEVVSDRKLPIELSASGTVDYYTADVLSFNDYYPYGMILPESCQDITYQPTEGVYAENFNASSSINDWGTDPTQQNVSTITHSPDGRLKLEATASNAHARKLFALVQGEQYKVSFYLNHTATAPGLAIVEANNFASFYFVALQQGYNEYTFTATQADMFLGFIETGSPSAPSGISEFYVDDMTLVRLDGSPVTESAICYGNGSETSDDYRYSFNGMEADDEIKGTENSYTTEFRQYDPRVGRWLSLDPITHEMYSPYSSFDNNPIVIKDPRGADGEDGVSPETQIISGGKVGGGDLALPSSATEIEIAEKDGDGFKKGDVMSFRDQKMTFVYEGGNYVAHGEREHNMYYYPPTIVEVVSGDFLGKIAERYNKSVGQLIEYNESITEENKGNLKVGQKIVVSAYSFQERHDVPTFQFDGSRNVQAILGTGGTALATQRAGVYFKIVERMNVPIAIVAAIVAGNSDAHAQLQEYRDKYYTKAEQKANTERAIKTHTDILKSKNRFTGGTENFACFVAGTLIQMADGTVKVVEKIQVGDVVSSINVTSMKVESDTVVRIVSPMHDDMVEIRSPYQSNINTVDHPYFVKNKGWSSVYPEATTSKYNLDCSLLEVGDTIYYLVNNQLLTVPVEEITLLDTTAIQTYNFNVKRNSNYIANGMLVHNKCCFEEGCLVTLADGKQLPIEKIENGDVVMSFDVENQEYTKSEVKEVSKRVHEDLVTLIFSDGNEISATLDHPIYVVDKGWSSFQPSLTDDNYSIKVDGLEVGDRCIMIVGSDTKEVTLTDIKVVRKVRKTYNLSGLSNGNTYFVNGILVTNER